jgi:pimeloyl-ACP methyl ester carboxylesterase
VPRILRVILNLVIALVLLAALLAAVTAVGTVAIERAYPPAGRFVEVTGGRLHVLELGPPDGTPVVLLHGASGNLQDMRLTLGELLAKRHRVILIDRPGHGWSDRPGGDEDASSARQAALIREVLDRLGVTRAIVVGHSFAGSVVMAFALAYPDRVAGLVLLAPATHPWTTGIAWFYTLTATPVVGPLFARTVALPAAFPFLGTLARTVFTPQPMPQDYPRRTALALLLRPSEFVANAKDVAGLLDSVTRQSPRYGEIAAPTVIITGDRDTIVSPDIHSRALARTLPHAELIVLPGVGHAVQHVAADLVAAEIDKLSAVILGKPQSGATRDP